MRSKRVLVTGGAGFISSNVIRYLLAATPYEVVSLDALTYAGNLENLADVMSHERLSFVHGDIRDAELVAEVVDEVRRDEAGAAGDEDAFRRHPSSRSIVYSGRPSTSR